MNRRLRAESDSKQTRKLPSKEKTIIAMMEKEMEETKIERTHKKMSFFRLETKTWK